MNGRCPSRRADRPTRPTCSARAQFAAAADALRDEVLLATLRAAQQRIVQHEPLVPSTLASPLFDRLSTDLEALIERKLRALAPSGTGP